ncbi:MAG: lysylphosphatidylglycerol synthase domain-containing protein [Elusimicrobiota bacterium]|nr:MAG: lysylphosphatidylglycerol synthase domain-containing protein [Elusimicrobiota bacterium]
MKGARRWFTAFVLVLGTATFLYLLWSFGPMAVWRRLSGFGWGFVVVIPFQVFDHALNALGWRYAFAPEEARRVGFMDLIRVRVAGDGVNYLTPSGNIAGEFVRPGMLRTDLPQDARVSSVVIAKATQAAGQAVFVLGGLIYLLNVKAYAFQAGQAGWAAAGMSVILVGVALCVGVFAMRPPPGSRRGFPTPWPRASRCACTCAASSRGTPGASRPRPCFSWSATRGAPPRSGSSACFSAPRCPSRPPCAWSSSPTSSTPSPSWCPPRSAPRKAARP